MSTGMEAGEVATVATGMQRAVTPSRLTTTLYDLMAALQDVVGLEDDALVVATMVHLLQSGRLTRLRTDRALRCEAHSAVAPAGQRLPSR
jgi:hypothetical protein